MFNIDLVALFKRPITMIKNIYRTQAILFAICLVSCNFFKKHSDSKDLKEFEGVITYKFNVWFAGAYDVANDEIDTVRIFCSHGNLATIEYDNNSNVVGRSLFLTRGPRYYYTQASIDTLYSFDITKNTGTELLELKLGSYNKKILGRKCEVMNITVKNQRYHKTYITAYQYMFSRGYLTVDKNCFRQYKLGFLDKFIDESGCFYLQYKVENYSITGKKVVSGSEYEAISVKEQKLDPKIFEPDKLPLKELKL